MTKSLVRAPFPWFGGKSRVAGAVWQRFGDVPNYVEPFAGSLAVLLGRPTPPRTETVNDLDCYLANFWRAIQHDPEAVARFADWPVNECDMHSRHLWLVRQGKERIASLKADPDFYDAQVAGWWVWGLCAWIGDGWCRDLDQRRPHLTHNGAAIHSGQGQTGRPHLGHGGTGVHAPRTRTVVQTHQKRPQLSAGKKPRVGSRSQFGLHLGRVHALRSISGHRAGQDIDALAPGPQTHLANGGRAIHSASGQEGGLYAWLEALATRLRRTRVCCGDWSRVLTPAVTTENGLTGVLLDPPYASHLRTDCYTHDSAGISSAVREWAVANGDNPLLRIALCGYVGEHDMPSSWECLAWKTRGGYGNLSVKGRGRENAGRERIWFSPACLRPGLFGDMDRQV